MIALEGPGGAGRVAVWAMMAMPFRDDGSIDEASLRRYSRTLVERGCDALVMHGVIGEPTTLTADERQHAVEVVLDSVPVPVHVGVLAAASAERAREAAQLERRFGGRLAGLMVPVDAGERADLAEGIGAVAASCSYPLTLQDYPAATGIRVDVETLARTVRDTDRVVAIKCEAAPTFFRIRALRRRLPGVRMMSGLGGVGLVDDLSQGASVVACGISRPEVVVSACRLWESGRQQAAREAMSGIGPLIHYETQQGTSIGIRKEHWRRQGVLASAAVRTPTLAYEPFMSALSTAHGVVDPGSGGADQRQDWMQSAVR